MTSGVVRLPSSAGLAAVAALLGTAAARARGSAAAALREFPERGRTGRATRVGSTFARRWLSSPSWPTGAGRASRCRPHARRRAISQGHGHSSVSTLRRALSTIRSSDLVHRLPCHFGGLGAGRHSNGDAGGSEIVEGHRARARRRGAGGASCRPVRRGDDDRHCLTGRTSHFDDQARTADQRATTGAADVAPCAKGGDEHQSRRQGTRNRHHRILAGDGVGMGCAMLDAGDARLVGH
jgi:hypothetical protein